MPGEKGKILQGKKAKYAIYLSDVVRMFKKHDDRIVLSTQELIASIAKDGSVTNGKRLYKIVHALYKREHRNRN